MFNERIYTYNMKKKKRSVDTFKNWLLARDSSSRISTKSNYNGFFEGENKNEKELELLFRRSRKK